jgi:hypothetical protein
MARFLGKVSELATCQHCGTAQLPENGLRCRMCSATLLTPLRVYRRNWKGEWIPVQNLDLTLVLPAPPRRRRRPLNKRWIALVLLIVLPTGILSGWSWNAKRVSAQAQAAWQARRKRGPGNLEVKIDATARWVKNGGVVISGDTNLPDDTILEAGIVYGDTDLARSFPIVVRGGSFESPVLANHGGAFEPGEYGIELLARFAPGEQNQEIFDSVGPKGSELSGPLVVASAENPTVRQVTFLKGIHLR